MSDGTKERLAVEALPGYEPEIGRLLWMLEQGRERTKASLLDLAGDSLDWAPGPKENSIGAILYHIGAIEADWLFVEVLEERLFPQEVVDLFPEDVRDDQGQLAIARGASLETHLDRLAVVRRHLLAGFQGMSLAEFRRARDLPDYLVTPEWVLHHLLQHEAEHRGEIMALLKLTPKSEG